VARDANNWNQHAGIRVASIDRRRKSIKGSFDFRRHLRRANELQGELLAIGLRLRPRKREGAKIIAGIIGDHICDAIRAHDKYERVFLEFIRDGLFERNACREKIALDVGANIGNHSLFLSDLFKRVIAFEPNPVARTLLRLNIEMNGIENVDVRSVGLADKAATATLAFDYENLGAATAFGPGKDLEIQRSQIELVVGDDVLNHSEPIGFIKIDVEGAEEAVLAGLRNTISSHRPVVMLEQWEEAIDALSGSSPSSTFLSELGYSAWELRPKPLFRGQLGKLTSLVLGRTDYRLEPVQRLDKRDYRALFFFPETAQPQ
jgi:FkbM family methyltransferase